MSHQHKVLFVCLGNICRSPTAEGIMKKLVKDKQLSHQILVDSAGTSSYHNGSAPDRRAQAVARERGVDLSGQVSRVVDVRDLTSHTHIIAMDRSNLQDLQSLWRANEMHSDLHNQSADKMQLMTHYLAESSIQDVPDPYYGDSGFEKVFQLIHTACEGLMQQLTAR